MLTFVRVFYALMGCLALSACGPAATVGASQKAPDYNDKIQSLLVVRNLSPEYPSEVDSNAMMNLEEIKKACDANLSASLNGQLYYVDIGGLGPSNVYDQQKMAAVRNAISTMHPTHVLQLEANSYTRTGGALDSYSVDATLTDTARGNVIWRMQVTLASFAASGRARAFRLGRLSHQDDADDVIKAVASKLKTDHLL